MSTAPAPPAAILAEDPQFIAVFKPAGWIVQGARPQDRSLLEEIRAWIEVRDRKPGRAFLAAVHRLDRPVCGVVVLAKRTKAASRLSATIRERNLDPAAPWYLRLCGGVEDWEEASDGIPATPTGDPSSGVMRPWSSEPSLRSGDGMASSARSRS